MKKAQSGIEFAVILGAVFFFFVAFIVLINFSIEKKDYEKKDLALTVEANYLADEIALAHQAGEGYERNFTLPQTVLGKNYQIEIVEKKSIYIHTNEDPPRHAMSIPCLEVNYTIPDGKEDRYQINITYPNIIKNINGIINISNS